MMFSCTRTAAEHKAEDTICRSSTKEE